MRRLSTSHVAAYAATIVSLFIVGACAPQSLPTPAVEPVVSPTSALGDSLDVLSNNQVVGKTSRNNSIQADGQITGTPDPTTTATQEDGQTSGTPDPTATATQADGQITGTPDPTATVTATATATQADGQTSDSLDPTTTATQADIETIIDSMLAELINDAMMDMRDLEKEVEADIALLTDDEQAMIGIGE